MISSSQQTGSVAGLCQEVGISHDGTRTAKEAV
jgi:hypothetical protein